MSGKSSKGYFVRGEYIASGSARDLELQEEQRQLAEHSRSARKRDADALQQLGIELVALSAAKRLRLPVPETLRQALDEAARITDFGGRRRQLQYVGKLMRKLPLEAQEACRAAIEQDARGGALATALLHEAEHWRDRLLQDDAALEQWLHQHPETEAQPLRALVRQARKDAKPERPGAAPRHGRAYRLLFQQLRDTLQPASDTPTPDPEAPPSVD